MEAKERGGKRKKYETNQRRGEKGEKKKGERGRRKWTRGGERFLIFAPREKQNVVAYGYYNQSCIKTMTTQTRESSPLKIN